MLTEKPGRIVNHLPSGWATPQPDIMIVLRAKQMVIAELIESIAFCVGLVMAMADFAPTSSPQPLTPRSGRSWE
ncbi:MAG: hypothetical protein WAN35_13235 [Terracidiphilus sp.]